MNDNEKTEPSKAITDRYGKLTTRLYATPLGGGPEVLVAETECHVSWMTTFQAIWRATDTE